MYGKRQKIYGIFQTAKIEQMKIVPKREPTMTMPRMDDAIATIESVGVCDSHHNNNGKWPLF